MKKTVLILGIIFLLIGVSVVSSIENTSKTSSLYNSNNPPYEPSNPYPSDGSIDNTICPPNLSWTGGDPDGDNVTYDVYFGEECPPPLVASNVTNTWYQLSFLLEFATNYCWMIVAEDEYGLITIGPIWIFTTEVNFPPYPPSNAFPPNNAEYVPINVTFCWTGGDPNECDMVTYDVYFGVTIPPTKKSSNQSATCFKSGTLIEFKTYYWYIVAWDSQGLSTMGPIWSFTTGHPSPGPPIIDGPKHGRVGVKYTYTFNLTETYEHLFIYEVRWGDGSSEIVHPTNPAGTGPGIANHSWDKKGTYVIRARIRDPFNYYSPWGELIVTMPRGKSISNSPLMRFFDRYPLLNGLLFSISNLLYFLDQKTGVT